MFKGLLIAVPTPFDQQGNLDIPSYERFLNWLLSGGVDGVVVCGTTGEAATLTLEERERLIQSTLEVIDGKVPVLVGTGSNVTAQAVHLTKQAKALGAAGALVVTPYYNKPNQRGLLQYFEELSHVGLPLCIYNVPGRTGVNLLPDTVKKLFAMKEVVSLKEASGNLSQCEEVLSCKRDDFTFLAGDDALYFPLLCLGADGIISVAGNLVPDKLSKLRTHVLEGNLREARSLHYHLRPLFEALFCDTNPVPVKYALSELGLMTPMVHSPLVELEPEKKTHVKKVLQRLELIS